MSENSKVCKLLIPDYVGRAWLGYGSGARLIKLEVGATIYWPNFDPLGETTVTVTSVREINVEGEKYKMVEFSSDIWPISATYHVAHT